MADSTGEKTEEATPKKLRDARKKGQVAKSTDLIITFLFIGTFGILFALGAKIGKNIQLFMNGCFTSIEIYEPQNYFATLSGISKEAFMTFVKCLAPVAMTAFIIALALGYFQVGFLFALEPLKPNLKKLNPIEGIKKKFQLRSFMELIKSSIKLFLALLMAYLAVKASFKDIYLSINFSIIDSIKLYAYILKKIVMRVGLIFFAVAIIDFYYQKWQYKKDMRMTKDEVKREYKQEEGDPLIKSMRKQVHMEIAMHNMIQEVKNADAIVTNPTKIAVAIRYDEKEMNAPQVVAKGRNLWAKKIIEIAKKYNVPIMRNIPLAHALNKLEIGEEVPEELYEAVAEVLIFVQKLREQEQA